MLFDNFDKKIKEAAEQHHPAYDENAWKKMESLLNQHLPQQKGRRRFFLLAFTILLVGGGTFLLLSKPFTSNSGHVVQQTNNSTTNKMQADKTDETITVVLPPIDNTNGEIAPDNIGVPTKIEGKDRNALRIIDHRDLVARQLDKEADRNDLSLNNPADHDKDIAVDQPGKKNDLTPHAPVSLQPNETVPQKEDLVNSPVAKQGDIANNSQIQSSSSKKTTAKNGRPNVMNGFSFFVA